MTGAAILAGGILLILVAGLICRKLRVLLHG